MTPHVEAVDKGEAVESGPDVRVLGVRHHGPGSARLVRVALEHLQPEVVLIEAPADAESLVEFVRSEHLVPPVSLLAYGADRPEVSAFWPFAVFSPEWQAITWALGNNVPVRFMDLPAANVLAAQVAALDQVDSGAAAACDAGESGRGADSAAGGVVESDGGAGADTRPADESDPDGGTGNSEQGNSELGQDGRAQTKGRATDDVAHLRTDPIAVLAQAGGYDDPERWWEDVIESRGDDLPDAERALESFAAVTEAMAEIRLSTGELTEDRREVQREAQMRQVLRAVVKEGATRVAVVCGAWHAPALTLPLPPAAGDARALRGLPKLKTNLTWVPWTHGRLSYASGYGAGVSSPGWYAHLFAHRDRPVADWLTRVAAVLRAEDLPISTAHVIEAVRLAEMLAVVRGRPLAGLSEVSDATRAVICDGNDATLDLVTRRLVVGEALGEVPPETPTVPLESDLAATCRRLRFKREPIRSSKDLDLRKPTDVARSALLHRLALLGIGWGETATSDIRSLGTFRETWTLQWLPEFAVDVIEAAPWGTTVESAATNKVCSEALSANLSGLTGLLERALLANLGDAVPALLRALQVRSARDHDVLDLMAAFTPLVRTRRYGDVRGTDLSSLDLVIDALLIRICSGLPAAVTSLDDDGAEQLRRRLDEVHAAIGLRDDAEARRRWLDALATLVPRADVHALLAGRMVRLLLDAGGPRPGAGRCAA